MSGDDTEFKLGAQSITLTVPRSLWIREAVQLALGECSSVQTRVQVGAAALMLCAQTSKGPRYHHDVMAYGAACMEFLRQSGVPQGEIYRAAGAAISMIEESLPSDEEVEEARGNSGAPTGG